MSESVESVSPIEASCEVSLSTNVELVSILTPQEDSSLRIRFPDVTAADNALRTRDSSESPWTDA